MIFVWRNRNFIVMAGTNKPHGMINMTIANKFHSNQKLLNIKSNIPFSVDIIILDKNGKKSNAYDLF